MIVCLVPNPAIDLTYGVDLRRGEVNRPATVHKRAGGKGINVARLLVQRDIDTTLVLPYGGLSGAWVTEQLLAEGFPVHGVAVGADTRHTVTIVEPTGQPTSIYEQGLGITPDEWATVADASREQCRSAAVLVVSGSLPRGVDGSRLGDLIRQVSRSGFPVVVDTSGPALLDAARAGATCLKPNELELIEATGCRSWTSGARRLLDEGAGSVLVSRGPDGLAFCSTAGYVASPGVAVGARNPTGSGDAVVASIVTSLVAEHSSHELVRRANAAGAAAAMAPVAGELDEQELARLVALTTTEEHRWDS